MMIVTLPKDHEAFKRALEFVRGCGVYDPDSKSWEIEDDTDPALLAGLGLHRVASEQEQPGLFGEEL